MMYWLIGLAVAIVAYIIYLIKTAPEYEENEDGTLTPIYKNKDKNKDVNNDNNPDLKDKKDNEENLKEKGNSQNSDDNSDYNDK